MSDIDVETRDFAFAFCKGTILLPITSAFDGKINRLFTIEYDDLREVQKPDTPQEQKYPHDITTMLLH